MKSGKSYKSNVKMRYRIVAWVICITLVAAAVAIGVIATMSIGYAEPTDVAVTDPVDPDAGDENANPEDDADTGDESDADESGDDAADDAGDDDADESDEPEEPVSIDIVKYPQKMSVGAKSTISYELRNADPGAIVKWESGNDNVATVDSDGTVRALAAGKVEITASIGKAKASVLISVTEDVIEPKSFTIEVEEFTAEDMLLSKHDLKVGDEVHMTAKAAPEGAKIEGKYEWILEHTSVDERNVSEESSGDPAVIRPEGDNDESAVLEGLSKGEVTLTVKYVDDANKDEDDQVKLGDYKIVFLVSEEQAPVNFLIIVTFIVIVAIIIIIIVLIAVTSSRRRRRASRGNPPRAAKIQRKEAPRERARPDAREPRAGQNARERRPGAQERGTPGAQERARRDAQERGKPGAQERGRRDAQERARRGAQERARPGTQERARPEAQEYARQEAQERARQDEWERARREAQERARQNVREPMIEDGYEGSYKESNADPIGRMTRVYDTPSIQPDAPPQPANPQRPAGANPTKAPEEPFSLDDIE
ncbi:MAG: Ig-like domain-containing protein [Clostridiales Family XIII bacterium]|jgi:heme/copper-type cytochrome/quinol oxidase subunit 2|nr:Ig-like domain-containing protein [Clostridiales Family XIII bacterium]